MKKARFEALFTRHLEDSLTKAEESELMRMLDDPAGEPEVKEMIGCHWERWPGGEWPAGQCKELYASIRSAIGEGQGGSAEGGRVNRRVALFAVVALFLSAAASLALTRFSSPKGARTEAPQRATARPAATPPVSDTSGYIP